MIFDIPAIGERYESFTHPSGMRVLLCKKEFYTGYGLLCVDFGSLKEDCSLAAKPFSVPDGTAHFLEHKMFENADGVDAFERFTAIGADANAYTSTDRTCYLFSTSQDLCGALTVLLSNVLSPYFTKKNVKKEKGIIIEELKMYRDDPYESIARALTSAMYSESRIKKDICGSVASVRSITEDDLQRAYASFYRPSNMILALCGNYDRDSVTAALDAVLPAKRTRNGVCKVVCDRDALVRRRTATVYLDITTPSVAIGVKCPLSPAGSVRRLSSFNCMSVLAQALFSPSSPFVEELQNEGLLAQDSACEVVCDRYCAHIVFYAHVYDPAKTRTLFYRALETLKKEGLTQLSFERSKKQLWADLLASFNSSEGIASMLVSDALDGIETRSVPDAILALTKENADRYIENVLRRESISFVTALPAGQKSATASHAHKKGDLEK